MILNTTPERNNAGRIYVCSHYIRRYNLFTNSIYLCKPKLFQLEQINLPKSIRIFCFETWDVWFAIGKATKRSVLISLPPFSLISLRFDLAPFRNRAQIVTANYFKQFRSRLQRGVNATASWLSWDLSPPTRIKSLSWFTFFNVIKVIILVYVQFKFFFEKPLSPYLNILTSIWLLQ
jgi:hypothetical protein